MSKLIARGLTLAIAFTVLAHGAVETWSVAGFGFVIVALLLLWGVKVVVDRRLEVKLPATLWPLVALLVYGFVQSLEWTRGSGERASLSMDVEATRAALPVLFFLIAGFLIAANFLDTPERLRPFVTFLIVFGFAVAIFAIIQNFTWNGKFYWLRPTKMSGFGPFVNRNHFAGFMEMVIPLPIALILARVIRKDLWIMYAFVAILAGISVIISLSRGGMISTLFGLVFLGVARSRLRRTAARRQVKTHSLFVWLKRAAGAAAIGMILVAALFWLGAEPFLNRVAHSIEEVKASDTEGRVLNREWIWRNSLTMIGKHKIFGVGLGAFETVFPAYRFSGAEAIATHTHNDYLQILADGGLIGGALGLWFLIVMMRAIWQGMRADNRWLAAVALGGGASIFAMLIHSFFDFNLQIPSNALLFLVFCAIVSQIAATNRVTEGALQTLAAADLAKAL
jgi:O-antigen ligase